MASIHTGGLRPWEKASRPEDVPIKQVDANSPSNCSNVNAPSSVKACLTPSGLAPGLADVYVNSIDVKHSHYGPAPVKSSLSLQERCARCLLVAEECIQEEELRKLLETNDHPICYDGFEPSGRMHIAQGILKALNVNRLTSCGCVFVFWIADWFALLNNKMGGDLEKIKVCGQYFIEVWKAVGMDTRNVRFLWASDEINRHPGGYWLRVMDIARKNNITRLKRCCQIMGRGEGDEQPAANILYPSMQCADIFYLKADICQLGLDQRKVNVLAREYAEQLKMKKKPVILSHGMLPGLIEGCEKMSKSNPDSAIFMEDSVQDVNRKIKQAFCKPQTLEDNPCVSYVETLVFPWFGKFEVERKESNGGNVVFNTVEEFRAAYVAGSLHPGDLKPSLAKKINEMIAPVRQHFAENAEAKALLAKLKKYQAAK